MDTEFLAIFIDEGIDLLGRWEEICLELEKSPRKDLTEALFRTAHNLKGSSRSIGLMSFGATVHAIEDVVTLVRNSQMAVSPELVGFFLECQALLKTWLEKLRSDHAFEPDVSAVVARCEQLKTGAPPGAPAKTASPEAPATAAQPPAHASPGEAAPPEESAAGTASKADDTIRVATAKLDGLIQLIGELAIQQSIISHARSTGDTNTSTYINALNLSVKITREAQVLALALRMQPLKGLFKRLERTIRDVARAQAKTVEVVVTGDEVELDKTVIEAVTYPLVHIVRNSVDHGIEKSEVRQAAGKTDPARVSVSAAQDAGSVTISIQDNGRGLATEKILAKARDRQLISGDAQLSRQEIYNLLFLPGFSTAETVTDISGRGVGMDVVRRSVDALGGSIAIHSEEGRGTRMDITLPTSLAVIDALIVRLGPSSYAVPIGYLEEIVDLTVARPMTAMDGVPMIELRGKVLPLRHLSAHLPDHRGGMPQDHAAGQSPVNTALLIRSGSDRVAFIVDSIVRHQQVVVRPLSARLAKLRGFSGGTVMPDGEPGLIIDLPLLMKDYLAGIRRKEAI